MGCPNPCNPCDVAANDSGVELVGLPPQEVGRRRCGTRSGVALGRRRRKRVDVVRCLQINNCSGQHYSNRCVERCGVCGGCLERGTAWWMEGSLRCGHGTNESLAGHLACRVTRGRTRCCSSIISECLSSRPSISSCSSPHLTSPEPQNLHHSLNPSCTYND